VVKPIGAASLTVAVSLIWAPTAIGQPRDPREIQARKDCLKGNYDSGTSLLADLYAETGNENFVYNQARCYEQNGRPDEAILRFREYLRIARDLDPDETAKVERHIAECKTMKAEQEQHRDAGPTGTRPARAAVLPPPNLSPTVPPLVNAGTVLEPDPPTPQAAVASRPVYKTWWFWTGVGAVVAAGTVTAILLSRGPSSACSGISATCVEVR
jgi:hypothetical protein